MRTRCNVCVFVGTVEKVQRKHQDALLRLSFHFDVTLETKLDVMFERFRQQ